MGGLGEGRRPRLRLGEVVLRVGKIGRKHFACSGGSPQGSKCLGNSGGTSTPPETWAEFASFQGTIQPAALPGDTSQDSARGPLLCTSTVHPTRQGPDAPHPLLQTVAFPFLPKTGHQPLSAGLPLAVNWDRASTGLAANLTPAPGSTGPSAVRTSCGSPLGANRQDPPTPRASEVTGAGSCLRRPPSAPTLPRFA